jgi:hypothetical protein
MSKPVHSPEAAERRMSDNDLEATRTYLDPLDEWAQRLYAEARRARESEAGKFWSTVDGKVIGEQENEIASLRAALAAKDNALESMVSEAVREEERQWEKKLRKAEEENLALRALRAERVSWKTAAEDQNMWLAAHNRAVMALRELHGRTGLCHGAIMGFGCSGNVHSPKCATAAAALKEKP